MNRKKKFILFVCFLFLTFDAGISILLFVYMLTNFLNFPLHVGMFAFSH